MWLRARATSKNSSHKKRVRTSGFHFRLNPGAWFCLQNRLADEALQLIGEQATFNRPVTPRQTPAGLDASSASVGSSLTS
jgi:hypothetical protein